MADISNAVPVPAERVERRSVSMYVSDWRLVDELARRLGLDVSSALRVLVRTHPQFNNGK